eukprot:scaffold255362_cov22-Tisochrysis_lutea.AAC.1
MCIVVFERSLRTPKIRQQAQGATRVGAEDLPAGISVRMSLYKGVVRIPRCWLHTKTSRLMGSMHELEAV